MYTEAQEAALVEASPVTFEDAQALGRNFGKSVRSIIAKVQSMELVYIPKEKPEPAAPRVTKADVLARVMERLGSEDPALAGLNRARMDALVALDEALSS